MHAGLQVKALSCCDVPRCRVVVHVKQCFPKFERWRVKQRAEIDERVNSGSHPEIPICLLETYLATGGGGGANQDFLPGG